MQSDLQASQEPAFCTSQLWLDSEHLANDWLWCKCAFGHEMACLTALGLEFQHANSHQTARSLETWIHFFSVVQGAQMT